MIYDCVIIGAGLSGLASAIILSKNGLKTALVEKSDKTGPLVRGFHRKGYYFDTGFHHSGGIGKGSSGHFMLDYLGVTRDLRMIQCDPDCFDIVKFKDPSFEFCFPQGYERIQARLYEAFPDEKYAIDTYLTEIKKQCSVLPFINLDADPNPVNILENIHGISLDEFFSGLTGNRVLKSVLSIHCMLNGVPSFEQGLNNYAYIVGPYYESVNYIDGGGSKLIEAFEKAAKENGVDLFLNGNAEELVFSSSGELTGIRFKDGAPLNCRNIIATIHPLSLLKMVPEFRFRSSYVARIKSLEETPSAFILYCIAEADLDNMICSNLYLINDKESDFGNFQKPLEERPFNLIINKTGKTKDKTGYGFNVIVPASIKETEEWENSVRGNRPQEYLAFKAEIKERMLNHVISFFPGLAGKIQTVDCSSPLTLRDYSGNPFGSMYGAKHRIEQYNPFPMTRIPGLHLAGQSVVAPGLLGTMVSAFLACGNIIGHDYLRGEIKRWG